MRKILKSILILSFTTTILNSLIRDIVESIKIIKAASINQKIVDQNQIILSGNVEIVIDQGLHVWADTVTINKEKQFLEATSNDNSFVTLEGNNFLLLCKKLFLNFDNRTCCADDARFHMDGRFIKAKKAEKLPNDRWRFSKLSYTGCDKEFPHWSFCANEANINKYLIHIRNPIFKIGTFPVVWLPGVVVPSPSKSTSGFMAPKIWISKRYGYGGDLAFYWQIIPQVDATFGVNWRQRRGVDFYTEFRQAKSSESYTQLDIEYARDWNFLTEKNSHIIRSKKPRNRYDIEGKHFEHMRINDFAANHLIQINLASDPGIDYDFFSTTDSIEDLYNNDWIIRWNDSKNLCTFANDWSITIRDEFFFINDNPRHQRETQDRFEYFRVGHLEWISALRKIIGSLNYRHSAFVDGIFFHRRLTTKEIINLEIINSVTTYPLPRDNTFRLFYNGIFQTNFDLKNSYLCFNMEPILQVRSRTVPGVSPNSTLGGRLGADGAYKFLLKSNTTLAFKEKTYYNSDYDFSIFEQDLISWSFIPKTKQRQFFVVDEWDRIFPQNQIKYESRWNFYLDKLEADFNLGFGYEFYKQKDIFPLNRFSKHKYALPLQLQGQIYYKKQAFSFLQEYDLLYQKLMDAQLCFSFNIWDIELNLNWIYQDRELQIARRLFSNIPTFTYFSIKIPIAKKLNLTYGGEFYSYKNGVTGIFRGPQALLHRLKADYFGHCWGISVGYERKQNIQEGIARPETSYFFSFSLETLGAFSKRFKPEAQILKAPVDY